MSKLANCTEDDAAAALNGDEYYIYCTKDSFQPWQRGMRRPIE